MLDMFYLEKLPRFYMPTTGYKRPIAPQFFQHLVLSVISMLICMKLYFIVVSFSHFLVANEKEDVPCLIDVQVSFYVMRLIIALV